MWLAALAVLPVTSVLCNAVEVIGQDSFPMLRPDEEVKLLKFTHDRHRRVLPVPLRDLRPMCLYSVTASVPGAAPVAGVNVALTKDADDAGPFRQYLGPPPRWQKPQAPCASPAWITLLAWIFADTFVVSEEGYIKNAVLVEWEGAPHYLMVAAPISLSTRLSGSTEDGSFMANIRLDEWNGPLGVRPLFWYCVASIVASFAGSYMLVWRGLLAEYDDRNKKEE